MVTGDIPTEEQVCGLCKDWASRVELPSHVAMAALHPESKFSKAYGEGVHKSKYWDTTFEDSMDMIAKLSLSPQQFTTICT